MVDKKIIELAKTYIKLIPNNMDLKGAYLFGSYVNGNEREESDIDIALVIGKMNNFFDTQRMLMKLRRKIDLRIEPHPIGESDFTEKNPFAFEIKKNGIELKF